MYCTVLQSQYRLSNSIVKRVYCYMPKIMKTLLFNFFSLSFLLTVRVCTHLSAARNLLSLITATAGQEQVQGQSQPWGLTLNPPSRQNPELRQPSIHQEMTRLYIIS